MTGVALIVALGVVASLSVGLIWATFTAVRAIRDMATADVDKLQAERNQKDAEDERDDALAARAQMEIERDNARALAKAAQDSRNEAIKREVENAREAIAAADPAAAGAAIDELLRSPVMPLTPAASAGRGHRDTPAADVPATGPAPTDPAGRRRPT